MKPWGLSRLKWGRPGVGANGRPETLPNARPHAHIQTRQRDAPSHDLGCIQCLATTYPRREVLERVRRYASMSGSIPTRHPMYLLLASCRCTNTCHRLDSLQRQFAWSCDAKTTGTLKWNHEGYSRRLALAPPGAAFRDESFDVPVTYSVACSNRDMAFAGRLPHQSRAQGLCARQEVHPRAQIVRHRGSCGACQCHRRCPRTS